MITEMRSDRPSMRSAKAHIAWRSGRSSRRSSTIIARVLGRDGEDAQHAGPAFGEGRERVADGPDRASAAQIVGRVDRRRVAVVEHQGHVRFVHDDAIGADMGEELLREVGAHHVVGRRLEREDGEARRIDPLIEPGQAEARQRRQKNQHLARHHERDGEGEEPCRKPARERGHRQVLPPPGGERRLREPITSPPPSRIGRD